MNWYNELAKIASRIRAGVASEKDADIITELLDHMEKSPLVFHMSDQEVHDLNHYFLNGAGYIDYENYMPVHELCKRLREWNGLHPPRK